MKYCKSKNCKIFRAEATYIHQESDSHSHTSVFIYLALKVLHFTELQTVYGELCLSLLYILRGTSTCIGYTMRWRSLYRIYIHSWSPQAQCCAYRREPTKTSNVARFLTSVDHSDQLFLSCCMYMCNCHGVCSCLSHFSCGEFSNDFIVDFIHYMPSMK